jgi:predicted DsbA family dithiol-disulfide isomerase
MGQIVKVDAYFDLICPWCWIGKRHFDTACARLTKLVPDLCFDVHWHSIQLIPHVPPQGLPYLEFYEQRLGSPEAVCARQAQVQVAAANAGLTIEFARIKIFPNTWLAHRLLALAAQQLGLEAWQALQEALFEAYFVHGCDLGDTPTLVKLAKIHDVDLSTAEKFDAPSVWGEHLGVSGVPYFVFNQQWALSGAQPPEVFVSAMLRSSSLSLPPTA